ncbi:MAG: molybdopterin molybdotransferase MoeA [Thaumarchaeota archaeon]|nr:molybdopterin molybdotransferase MoeA [Nitrososphaerota archaeon]MCL5316700.1 molybdopterin molybdotransferase MoeA [Nitrososphaerota archaeon]
MKSQRLQKRFFKLISLEDALGRIEQATKDQPREVEVVGTVHCLGRVLAEDVVADTDLPDHNCAAMDGFAVNTRDIQDASDRNPVRLTINGELFPSDHPTDASIRRGETMYVTCGAPIPKGANAVLKIENARQKKNNAIVVQMPLEPNRNICLVGEDVEKQNLVLPRNRLIRPQDIGLLTALNRVTVKVFRRPRVAVISVGDELAQPFKATPNMIVNNNAYIITSLIEAFYGEPLIVGIARDNVEDISQKINAAARQADIVVTIAGCSVGVRDFVPDAVEEIGGSDGGVVFQGIALSAGKVSGFGLVHGKPVVMLPGHVGSTVASFCLLVLPLLNRQLGLGFADYLPVVRCVLDEPVRPGKPGIEVVLPVKMYRRGGEHHAVPMRRPLSVLKNLVDANGFALIQPGVALDAGAGVDVKVYSGLEFYAMREQ